MVTLSIVLLILFGHCVGDYILQNDWMALNKKDKLMPLLVHCFLYTTFVFVCILEYLLRLSWIMVVLSWAYIFVSHIILDGTHVIDKLLKMTGGRSWYTAKHKIETEKFTPDLAIYLSYTAIVQLIIDNFIHLALMIAFFSLIL